MLLHTSNTFINYNHKLKEADIIFIGIRFSGRALNSCSYYGSTIVRESLKLTEDSERLFEKLKICDVGDIEPGTSFETMSSQIRDTIEEIKNQNSKAMLCLIGGDHSITLPVIEALKPKTIVQFDAHADMRSEFLGDRYMQQTWAYHAAQKCKIIQVGVRAQSREEIENAKNLNVVQMNPEEFIRISKNIQNPVHITLDMDVFDPCYVETGLPEPDGLTPKQVLECLQKIK